MTASADDVPVEPLARKHNVILAQAQLLESDKEVDQALALCRNVLFDDPDNSRALHRSATLYARKGELALSEQAFLDALEADSDNAKIHCDYGYLCYLQERWDESEEHLLEAARLDSTIPQVHVNLGLLYARQGRLRESEQQFHAAGCDRSETHTNLAFARLLESDFDGAQNAYQQALEVAPDNQNAVNGVKMLERLGHRSETGTVHESIEFGE